MENIKFWIFDFDGVLGDTYDATNRAKVSMGQVKTIEEAEKTTLHYSNSKPFHGKKAPQKDIDSARIWTEKYAQHMLKQKLVLFDEFIEELKKIPLKQRKFAIISSGPGIVVRKMLKNIDIDFTHVLCHEDHHSKEEKLIHVCNDWGVSPLDVYYFTDSKSDVWELSPIMDSSKIIGCSWGHSGYDKLRELLPDNQIMKKFSDIHSIEEA